MSSFAPSNDTRESVTIHPQRVMIVDDHELFRHGLRDLINSINGFQVVAEANSCKEALTIAEQIRIDLIMLDMYLPDGDGIRFTRQLRQQVTPLPRVIVLSAMMPDDTLVDAILAGASGYLTKDIPASEIMKALEGFLRGELALLPLPAANLVRLLVQKHIQTEAELATYQHHKIPATTISPSKATELNLPVSTPNTAPDLLTPQEVKVFQLLRYGQSNKQIARKLSISPYTVGKHVQNILHKLGVTNRTQAASYTSFEGASIFKDGL